MTEYSSLLGLPLPALAQKDWKQPEDEVKAILDFVVYALLNRHRIVNGGVVSNGGGLTADYSAYVAKMDGKRFLDTDGGSTVLSAAPAGLEELRFIYVDASGSVQGSGNQPIGDYVPLAAAYVSDTAIMRIADLRPMSAVSVGDNLLINPEFLVNQLGYAADGVATLDDGEYGHDMMRNMTGSTQKYSIDGSGNIDLDTMVLGQKNDNILAKDGETVTFSVETGEVQIYGLGLATWTTVSPTSPCTWPLDASGNAGWFQFKKSGTNTFRRPKLEPGYVPTRSMSRDITVEKVMCYRYLWNRPLATSDIGFEHGANKQAAFFPVSYPVEMRVAPTCTVEIENTDNSAATAATAATGISTLGIRGIGFNNAPGSGTYRFKLGILADANYYT